MSEPHLAEKTSVTTLNSPIGYLELTASSRGLVTCRRVSRKSSSSKLTNPILKKAVEACNEYFAGNLDALKGVPLDPRGSRFQSEVWNELRRIKPGKTSSYSLVASKIGRPNAQRAVGTACGKNPLLLFIPCHRVLTSSGHLGGFSAGLDAQRTLIGLENIPLG